MVTTDVRTYEVNHCREREDIPNEIERRDIKVELSRISKAAKRSEEKSKIEERVF